MARIIGLTGGIASGKSTVTSYLKEKGYPVIDADRVVHDLQAPGGELYRVLVVERSLPKKESWIASLWVSGSFQPLVKETGPIASKEGLFVRL